MSDTITKEEFVKKLHEDFLNTVAHPRRMFFAGLIDLVFIFGPSIIIGVFALRGLTNSGQVLLWLAIMLVAHIVITNVFKHNSIGKIIMGIRLACSKSYRLLSDDPNALNEYEDIGKDIKDKEDVFILFDALNGYSKSKLNRLGIVTVKLNEYKVFQETYKIHETL